jgi:hypothetical protein
MMNRLYIHWKDCHHRRLPPIRVAYIHRSSARNRSIGHALEEGWNKRLPQSQRRRKGSSRSSIGVGRVQRRASVRARRMHAFGRASPENIDMHKTLSGAITAPGLTAGDQALRAAGIDLKGTVTPGPKYEKERSRSEGLYSLMHVPEPPVDWTLSKPGDQDRSSDIASQAAQRSSRRAEYAHIGSLEWLVTDSIWKSEY